MTQSPERGKQRLHISHQDKQGNNDTRIMMFSPDEDSFSSLITRIQHKLNAPAINRLKYLNRDGIEIVVGDDEDLEVALYLEGDVAAHTFWTMQRRESL
jgi:PB1 domain